MNVTADLTQIKPLRNMGDKLQEELPAYLSAANGFTIDHSDPKAFTKGVLSWWANHGTKFPTWAEAAQIVFSFTRFRSSSYTSVMTATPPWQTRYRQL